MNFNKVFVLGRLTADPQLRSTPTGQQVANFGVATNRVWNDKAGQRQEATEFHNIVVWGRQAEIASRFLIKGSLIFVEGRLQTRTWDDKQGQRHRTTEVVADRIQIGPKPAGRGGDSSRETPDSGTLAAAPEIPTINIEEDIKAEDLPF